MVAVVRGITSLRFNEVGRGVAGHMLLALCDHLAVSLAGQLGRNDNDLRVSEWLLSPTSGTGIACLFSSQLPASDSLIASDGSNA